MLVAQLKPIVENSDSEEISPAKTFNISGFIICHNESHNLLRCIKSLDFCDEIIVVDSYSTDNSVQIAEKLGAKVYQKKWNNFRDQKEFAMNLAQHDWVLNIDADEEISDELKTNIAEVFEKPEEKVSGYIVNRVNFFHGRWWTAGGWYPEYKLRLFKRSRAHWLDKQVHEKVIVDGTVKKLEGYLLHYSFKNFRHFFEKQIVYAYAAAEDAFRRGERFRLYNLLLNPVSRFCKFFILKKGFLEGVAGFVVACGESFYTFLKYVRLWELCRKNHEQQ